MKMNAKEQKEMKEGFTYPDKIEQLFDPIFYTITSEEVEVEGSFEGVETEYFIETAGVKILLREAVNKMLAYSPLAEQFIGLWERTRSVRTSQKAYFKAKRASDLKEARRLEGKIDNYLEVCRPTHTTLKKYQKK